MDAYTRNRLLTSLGRMLDAEPNGTLPNGMVFRYVSRRYGTYANICHVSDIYA